MNSGDKMTVNNIEKAELLVQTFRKVHSSDSLIEKARQYRNLMKNPKILKKREISGDR